MNTFSATAAFSAGWQTFTKRAWFFIGSFLLATVIELVVSQAFKELGQLGVAAGIIGNIASLGVSILYGMGVVNVTLKAADNAESVVLRDFWHPHPFWNFVGASLLVAAVVILAVIGSAAIGGIASAIAYAVSHAAGVPVFITVFAILGIASATYLGILFMFFRYLVIARNLAPIASLKESMRITAGHRMQLLGLIILSLLAILLGAILLVVGLLVAIPVVAFATVHAYRTLEQQSSEPVPAAAM